jgi:lambda repressor-like predicted transcriptional regulator
MTKAQRAQRDRLIATLYKQGRSLRQIAPQFQLSIMGVRYALDREGVAVRAPYGGGLLVARIPDEAAGWA